MKRKTAIILGLSLIIVVSTSVGVFYGLNKNKKIEDPNVLKISEGLTIYKTSFSIKLMQNFGTSSMLIDSLGLKGDISPNLYLEQNSMVGFTPTDFDFLNLSMTKNEWAHYTQFTERNKTIIPIWINSSISSNVFTVLSYNISSPDNEIISINCDFQDKKNEQLKISSSSQSSLNFYLFINNYSFYQSYYNEFKNEDIFNCYFCQNSSIHEILTHKFNLTERITIEYHQNIFLYHEEGGLKVIDERYDFCLGNVSITHYSIMEDSMISIFDGWVQNYQYVFLDMADLPETKSHLVDFNTARIEGDTLVFYNSGV